MSDQTVLEKNKLLNLRIVVLAMADFLVVFASAAIALFICINVEIRFSLIQLLWPVLLFLGCNYITFGIIGVYNSMLRYATAKDYIKIALGVTVSMVVSLVAVLFFGQVKLYAFMMITYLVTLCGSVGMRLFYQYLISIRLQKRGDMDAHKKNMLIVGAGMTCKMLLNEVQSTFNEYVPVAVVDDDVLKKHRYINGVKVLGDTNDIPQLCEKLKIDSILFAIPSCPEGERARILRICAKTRCQVKSLPYLHELIETTALLGQAQAIKIEDLLGRPVVTFDKKEVASFIRDEVCMVTGGGGSIGSELCRQIMRYRPKQLVIVDIYENNAYQIQQELLRKYGEEFPLSVQIASVRDFDKMEQLFKQFRPTVVFHAAAHKHVPLMETNPEEAVKNNVMGTFHTAVLANQFRVKRFVMVSTDKAVNPTNVMGATKRCCEMVMQYMSEHSANTEYVAVRFGNVLGSNGSVIPLFKEQIENGGPVTVTHPDIIRYFMTIPEAVSLILQAGAMAHGGEIFVLDMGEPVKIVTLAENLIRQYGMEPYLDIPITFTGLRPGEKLYEELLMEEEGLKSTMNHKIYIGSQIEVDSADFMRKMKALQSVMNGEDKELIIEKLHDLVPTFQHEKIYEIDFKRAERSVIDSFPVEKTEKKETKAALA